MVWVAGMRSTACTRFLRAGLLIAHAFRGTHCQRRLDVYQLKTMHNEYTNLHDMVRTSRCGPCRADWCIRCAWSSVGKHRAFADNACPGMRAQSEAQPVGSAYTPLSACPLPKPCLTSVRPVTRPHSGGKDQLC